MSDLELDGLAGDEPLESVKGPNPDGLEDITGDGGVTKRILAAGTGWETPGTGDEVAVHYVGTLTDGKEFDSSRGRNAPFVFELGRGRVIKAWDAGVKTMKKGERAVLTCSAPYAYGEAGSPPAIPPNATLVFEVELLHWKSTKDITDGKGGVLKTTLTEGTGYRTPSGKDEVLVTYTLRVKGQSTPFQESPEDGYEASLDKGVICPAFDIALKKMKKGEKASLVIKSEYGPSQGQLPSEVSQGCTLEAELELVSWKQVSNITDDGLVVKKILQESSDYNTPNAEAKVTVRYTARLEDGTIFDERGEGNELEFLADEDQVVEGLDLAVMKMKPGEKAEVTIQPKYAYKDEAFEAPQAVVPKGATLVYTLELVSIEKAREGYEMTTEEKLSKASDRKEAGNALFKSGANAAAVKRYKRATELINFDDQFSAEEKRQSKDIKKSCNLNLAAAYLKLKDFSQAQAACSKVLEQDALNVKALYRRAQAYLDSQDYVEAEQDIKSLLSADSTSRDARQLLMRYRKESAAFNQRQRSMFKNLFKPRSEPHSSKPSEGAVQTNGVANGHAAAMDAVNEEAGVAPTTAAPESHPIDV